MKNCKKTLAGFALGVCMSTSSFAATVVLDVDTRAVGTSSFSGTFQEVTSDRINRDSLVPERVFSEARASGDEGFGKGVANAGADATTGELKVDVGVDSGGLNGSATATAQSRISQSFTLSGAGNFTAVMSVDAIWAVSAFSFAAQVVASGGTAGGSLPGHYQAQSAGLFDRGRVDDELVSTSFFHPGGPSDILVEWSLFADVSGQTGFGTSGFVDGSNTGLLYFFTDGTLTATPTTAGFLSNPSYLNPPTNPIPLPAGFALLPMGLLALFGVGRRKPGASITSG